MILQPEGWRGGSGPWPLPAASLFTAPQLLREEQWDIAFCLSGVNLVSLVKAHSWRPNAFPVHGSGSPEAEVCPRPGEENLSPCRCPAGSALLGVESVCCLGSVTGRPPPPCTHPGWLVVLLAPHPALQSCVGHRPGDGGPGSAGLRTGSQTWASQPSCPCHSSLLLPQNHLNVKESRRGAVCAVAVGCPPGMPTSRIPAPGLSLGCSPFDVPSCQRAP